jgi:hypothetical protein
MSIPAQPGPLRTYSDPSLWSRLAPLIRERWQEKTQHLIDGRWQTVEEARGIIGYLKAIDWIFATADDLTRIEDDEHEPAGR